jgi:hypothetical protein
LKLKTRSTTSAKLEHFLLFSSLTVLRHVQT